MKQWTKEEAVKTLKGLAIDVEKLKAYRVFSTEHTMWITKCLETLEEVFGRSSRYYSSFYLIKWGEIPNGTIIDPWEYGGDYQRAVDTIRHEFYTRDIDTARGFLLGAVNYLNERELKDVYISKESGNETTLALKVLNLIEQKLRKLIREKPEKEKTIQDAFENLLIGADIPYGREVESIEYSSKKYIPDFSLQELDLAVEIKLCGHEQRIKELPEEINDDILSYKVKYKNLIFVVYDLGVIRDADKFCGSFEKQENVTVRVIKH